MFYGTYDNVEEALKRYKELYGDEAYEELVEILRKEAGE